MCGVASDHQANGDYVDVSLTCCECGLGSMGSWSYSKEGVWNLGKKSVKVKLQHDDIPGI